MGAIAAPTFFEGGDNLVEIALSDPAPDDRVDRLDMAHPIEVGLKSRDRRLRPDRPVSSSTRRTMLGAAAESATQRLSRVR